MNNLFETVVSKEVRGGKHYLNSTAQLTAVAEGIAAEILQTILSDQEFAEEIKGSQESHGKMDALIEKVYPLQEVDVEFLKEEDEDTAEKMIRSQQSKRSRAKSKPMTKENYTTLMVGAISENLLRIAFNKPKGAYNAGFTAGEVTYTEEQLEALEKDPVALTKAIRNVQSKKSIAKSKADFSEESERWQQLLVAEQQLKDLRSKVSGLVTKEAQEAIEAKSKAENLLADIEDIDKLPAKDAKELLAKLNEALLSR